VPYDFDEELRAVGALKSGHFVLASGRHSNQYIEKFDLLRQPFATQIACSELVHRLGELSDVDLVVGPTTGGILLAFELGRQLHLPAAYAERISDGSATRAFKRGTTISAGTRVLVVDDIMTTGGSVVETLEALYVWKALPVAIALLVDRSGGEVDIGYPTVALSNLTIETWSPDNCVQCNAGIPLTHPGSTASSKT